MKEYLLLPLVGVEFLEAFVAEEFEFLVGLVQFGGNQFLVCGVSFSHIVLGVRLVPQGVAVDGLKSEA